MTAEYELDQIEVTEGIQMTGRHGPEGNRQPAATSGNQRQPGKQ